MGEPSSGTSPARQPSPSMLSIYLQRASSGQLTTGAPQPRQLEAAGHLSLSAPQPDPSPRQLLPPQPSLPGASLLSSPFYAHLRDSPQDLFPFGATSIPVAERPPSLAAPSHSSNDPPLGGAHTRQLSANVAFSPSRSSLGSGYSLQSGAGDDPGVAEASPRGAGPMAGSGSAGGAAGGSWQPSGSGASAAYGPGGFPGVSDEDLAAMDPKRAKRLIANRQSAQRSKARKLRHIMQLEEEVATLQGISAQQQATISGLQQEASLLTTGNHQLNVQVAELQEALQKQEAFTELVIAELRRLSVLAGEPPQLPTFSPGTLQEQQLQAQMAPQLSDIALQQQLASQYGLSGFAGVGYQQYPAAQQFPTALVPQYGLAQLGGMQQMPQQRVGLPTEGTFYQPSQQIHQQQQQRQMRQQQQPRQIRQQQQPRPPGPVSRQPPPPQPPPQRAQPRPQPAGRSPTGQQGAPSPREAGLPPRASLERPASEPLPAAVAEAAAAAVAEERGGSAAAAAQGAAAAAVQSTEAVRDAALHALALAERRSVRFSADVPRSDGAAESRRLALATAGRGNTFPLARGEAAARRAAVRTLSAPVSDAAAAGAAPEQPPQPDPFRVNVPASAFQVEERRLSQEVPARREQQAQAQQFAAVLEQEDLQSWQQQQQPPQMAWPLGPRAQQPYPVAAGPVGNVMQAFRGLALQGTASDPAALPPSGMAQRMQSQLPYGSTLQPGGRYGNLSWDEMMRSLSDPVFQTGQDGTRIIPPGFYSQRVEGIGLSGGGPFESFYNLEQPEAAQQPPQPQPPPHQQEQQHPGGDAAPHQR
ncbi:probable transcription factor VIP1 at N-terminal half [Coccomyxa sp. Obi]|nr:probable transcription factor VIP1 at N-terminal half [Coccomyxa sp. Obi]